jgi:hypothetical protein
LNHNRPSLKSADNIRKAISEIESWYAPEKNLTVREKSSVIKKQIIPQSQVITVKKKSSQKELDEKIHSIACSIVEHVHMHREVSLCNKLCLSLIGSRQEAMINWFVTYAACTYDLLKKQLIFSKEGKNQVEECQKKDFLDFKRQTAEKSFNLREGVAKLVTKAENRLKDKALHEIDEIDLAVLRALKQLIVQ